MPQSPAPSPDHALIQRVADLSAKLAVERMVRDAVEPLKKEFGDLKGSVRVVESHLIGNGAPGLLRRFEDFLLQNKADHKELYRRIEELVQKRPATPSGDNESSKLWERAKGAWWLLSTLALVAVAVVDIGLKVYKAIHP